MMPNYSDHYISLSMVRHHLDCGVLDVKKLHRQGRIDKIGNYYSYADTMKLKSLIDSGELDLNAMKCVYKSLS